MVAKPGSTQPVFFLRGSEAGFFSRRTFWRPPLGYAVVNGAASGIHFGAKATAGSLSLLELRLLQ